MRRFPGPVVSAVAERELSRFSAHLWLMLAMLGVFVITGALYVRAEKAIDRANEIHLESVLIAEELRTSSNDLTRMVRSYVVTGDPVFKRFFQEILDIRDGKQPRPADYRYAYWDLVLAGVPQRAVEPAMPLLAMMRRAGVTEQELAKVAEAKANSDALTGIEFAAMAMIESDAAPDPVRRSQAIRMLYSTDYNQARAAIMQPITEFERMVDQRTLQNVDDAKTRAMQLRLALLALGLLQVALLWWTRARVRAILGGSIEDVYRSIARLGRGEFSTPIPVPAGRENSVLGWLSETRTKLSQLALRRFKAIVDSTDDAIIGKTLDGTIDSWNLGAEKLFGYTAWEVIGKPVLVLIPEDRAAEEAAILARIARGGEFRHLETVRRHKDGRRIDVFATISPILDEAGKVCGASTIARDITGRKATEAELELHRHHLESLVAARTADLTVAKEAAEAASRAKDALLANMSHEFRTPLNGIMGMTGLALRRATDPVQQNQLAKAMKASEHLLALINDVLDIARIEADRLSLDRRGFRLAEVLEVLDTVVAASAAEKGLALKLDIDPALAALALRGDPRRLGQVLLNLAANAVKFTDNGLVDVRVHAAGRTPAEVVVHFEVRDTGIGIAEVDQGRLFVAFEQVDGSRTRRYGGTGLGLAISKRLVEMMGGTIGLESRPGAGSVFWFTARLGVVEGDARPPPAPSLPAESAGAGSGDPGARSGEA